MAKIDSFKFGSIVIDDQKYGRDVFIMPDGSVRQRKGGFWKFGSHSIKKAEVDEVVRAGPEMMVIGTGTSSKAKLGDGADLIAREANVELMVLPSHEAVKRFNELADEGKKVSALIHITC